ncbi:hypothetical protein ACFU7Y_38815 [Kitasatospora sp. NPDC057542]|uniref:hypothetical protein n=1 Tax=Kitasatospora sp. NPDC057542 TaxID=3346162 RepID=UPI003677453A
MPTPTRPSAALADVIPLPVADLAALDLTTLADPERLVTDAWLTPAIERALRLVDQADPHTLAAGSHTAPGHTMLLIAPPQGGHPAWYLRLPDGTTPAEPRPTNQTGAVLPLVGALDLALYRHRSDVDGQRSQYLRTLCPGQLCLLHTDATTQLTGAADSVQLIPTHLPPIDPHAVPLSLDDYQAAAATARYRLTVPRPDDAGRPGGPRLEDIPGLHAADLRHIHAQAGALHRLAADRTRLSYLVTTTVLTPDRYEASRTTTLADRLVLATADDRGFEIRLNTNPHPDNQQLPHTHAYPVTAHILTGGYLHTVHHRTDGKDNGYFTSRDLRPAVTTTELPGSTYTLAPTLVHQAVVLPGTTTLMLRGPHTADAHAAADLIPPISTWPAPADGQAPVHARRMTDAEHREVYGSLAAAGVIDLLPPCR